MSSYQEFHGKVSIVTGASSGIGRAIAVSLAGHGCCLTITGRKQESLEETRQHCLDAGLAEKNILIVLADMRKDDDIKSIVDKTIQKFEQLDFAVNNAGVVHADAMDDSMEKYHEVMQIDLHSIVYLNKLSFPYLEKTKGSIVNVSSIAGLRPIPGSLAYGMAKAALDHYTRIKSMEIVDAGIRVNNVNPGIVRTKIFENGGIPEPMVEMIWDRARTWTGHDRTGLPGEVAGAVCFLLSSRSGRTTGATVPIDGGFTSMCFPTRPTGGMAAVVKEM